MFPGAETSIGVIFLDSL